MDRSLVAVLFCTKQGDGQKTRVTTENQGNIEPKLAMLLVHVSTGHVPHITFIFHCVPALLISLALYQSKCPISGNTTDALVL